MNLFATFPGKKSELPFCWIQHDFSLASVYHKPPNSFVDGAKLPIKKLGNAGVAESGGAGEAPALVSEAPAAGGPSIIPSQVSENRIKKCTSKTAYSLKFLM